MIMDILKAFLNGFYQLLIGFGPIFGPVVMGTLLIAVARKHFILAFLFTSALSSLINIIIWIFPNHTETLAAGNQLLNLATLQNIIDIIIYAEMSTWGVWTNFIILPISIVLSYLYLKLIGN